MQPRSFATAAATAADTARARVAVVVNVALQLAFLRPVLVGNGRTFVTLFKNLKKKVKVPTQFSYFMASCGWQ